MGNIDIRICEKVREHKDLFGLDTSIMSDKYIIYILMNDAPSSYAYMRFSAAWEIFVDEILKVTGTQFCVDFILNKLFKKK